MLPLQERILPFVKIQEVIMFVLRQIVQRELERQPQIVQELERRQLVLALEHTNVQLVVQILEQQPVLVLEQHLLALILELEV